MASPTPSFRLFGAEFGSLLLICIATGTTFMPSNATAGENVLPPRPREEHGSQGATSEWLPILLGGAGGVVVGGVVGAAVDPTVPALPGPIIGTVLGGLTGGAAAAWGIRQMRAKDTRLAGTLTGLGVGTAIGVSVWAYIDPHDRNGELRPWETIARWSSLLIFPAVGAIAGRKLAITFGHKEAMTDDRPAPAPGTVTVMPTFGMGSFGFVGLF